MLKVLIITIAVFLSVLGLSELLHRLWITLLQPTKPNNILITVLDDEYAAEQITATLEDMRWNGKNSARVLMGVDCGLSPDKLRACRTIESLNDDFVLINPQNTIEEIIKRS